LAKNKKLYGLLVVLTAFHPHLVSLLPWIKTPITMVTMGFPTVNLCYFTTWLVLMESIVLTAINTSFAINQKHLFEESAIQQYEFLFSLSCTAVNGIVALIETFFLGMANEAQETQEVKEATDIEMHTMASTANPILNEVELSQQPIEHRREAVRNDPVIQHLQQTVQQLQDEKKKVDDRLVVLEKQLEEERVASSQRFAAVLQVAEQEKKAIEKQLEEERAISLQRFTTVKQQLLESALEKQAVQKQMEDEKKAIQKQLEDEKIAIRKQLEESVQQQLEQEKKVVQQQLEEEKIASSQRFATVEQQLQELQQMMQSMAKK
jgi:septal ring factor EnvC (AmiA/AmiB activator)